MRDKERILFLQKELAEHNHSYYVLDTPLISDFEFDKLLIELQQLEDINPDLFDPDNTTSDIGAIFYNQETECSLLGDINNDNQVNILDVVETVNFILFEPGFDSLNCSDINDDGVINIIDIVLMVNIILDI